MEQGNRNGHSQTAEEKDLMNHKGTSKMTRQTTLEENTMHISKYVGLDTHKILSWLSSV